MPVSCHRCSTPFLHSSPLLSLNSPTFLYREHFIPSPGTKAQATMEEAVDGLMRKCWNTVNYTKRWKGTVESSHLHSTKSCSRCSRGDDSRNQAIEEDHREMIRVRNDHSSASTSSMTVVAMKTRMKKRRASTRIRKTIIATKAKATQRRRQQSFTRLLLATATATIPASSNMKLQYRYRMQPAKCIIIQNAHH